MSTEATEVVDRGDVFNPFPEKAEAPAEEVVQAAPEAEEAVAETTAAPEAEESTKAEKETQAERDDKGRFIPKDRFDEAVRKERAEKDELSRRLRELEERESQRAVVNDMAEAQRAVRDMIKKHTSLLADGELDKAADLMERILELKEEMSDRRASAKADMAKTQAKEEVRYDALVARLEVDHPEINPESDVYDKDAVRRIQAMMTGLMQTERMSPTQALAEATKVLLAPAKKDAPKAEVAADLGMRRKEDAVKKALDVKTKQPASSKEVGLDHDKVGGPMDSSAIMKMSWDEFVKLPDSKLAELRGDNV